MYTINPHLMCAANDSTTIDVSPCETGGQQVELSTSISGHWARLIMAVIVACSPIRVIHRTFLSARWRQSCLTLGGGRKNCMCEYSSSSLLSPHCYIGLICWNRKLSHSPSNCVVIHVCDFRFYTLIYTCIKHLKFLQLSTLYLSGQWKHYFQSTWHTHTQYIVVSLYHKIWHWSWSPSYFASFLHPSRRQKHTHTHTQPFARLGLQRREKSWICRCPGTYPGVHHIAVIITWNRRRRSALQTGRPAAKWRDSDDLLL